MRKQSKQSREESVARTHQKYEMRKALLEEWEAQDPLTDPEYITKLRREVRYLQGQLVNKGAMLPNDV